jgi:hypothetical protein
VGRAETASHTRASKNTVPMAAGAISSSSVENLKK